MSSIKDIINMSDDELREKVVGYMAKHDMCPHAFAKSCRLSGGGAIRNFIQGGKIVFRTRMKIIKKINK